MSTNKVSLFSFILSLIFFLTYEGVKAAVDLVSFTATSQENSILVEWETATEIDNAGFYLTRNTQPVPPYEEVSEFIPAEGSGVIGANYQFVDDDVISGVIYYYMLEAVDTSQNIELHGPISVTFITQATLTLTSTPSRTPETQKSSTPTKSPIPSKSLTPTKSRTPAPGNTATAVPPTFTPTKFTETPTQTHTPSITPSPTLSDPPEIVVVLPTTNTPTPTFDTSTRLPTLTPTPKGRIEQIIDTGAITILSGICLLILAWATIAIGIFVYIQNKNTDLE